jgi:AraC-like DNA-binding protein
MQTGAIVEAFFRPHVPRGPLCRFVQLIWIARGQAAHRRERVLPNGVVELIVNLGNPHKTVGAGEHPRESTFRDSWIAGIQNRHLVIESVEGTDLIGIRFRPGGARALLDHPLSTLTDHVVELDLIDPALASELTGRVRDARTDAERIACIEHLLTQRMASRLAGHDSVRFICNSIWRARGIVRIGDLVERTGLSHRRVMDYFARDVGMTPKALAGICRFQNVLTRISSSSMPDWSAVAVDCGYFDQAHLSHEFRRLSGLAPREYLSLRLPDFNHAIAD